ncbi:hypothetical protein MHYP_G00225270 [Metynnis hypsauchen]
MAGRAHLSTKPFAIQVFSVVRKGPGARVFTLLCRWPEDKLSACRNLASSNSQVEIKRVKGIAMLCHISGPLTGAVRQQAYAGVMGGGVWSAWAGWDGGLMIQRLTHANTEKGVHLTSASAEEGRRCLEMALCVHNLSAS